mmetsp:Transcript_9092/g.26768  ORF Transcript_9092/g.26768 Transcript_9092/m.26768 type:complete len:204 (-) Transcript_9092:16-627(-)
MTASWAAWALLICASTSRGSSCAFSSTAASSLGATTEAFLRPSPKDDANDQFVCPSTCTEQPSTARTSRVLRLPSVASISRLLASRLSAASLLLEAVARASAQWANADAARLDKSVSSGRSHLELSISSKASSPANDAICNSTSSRSLRDASSNLSANKAKHCVASFPFIQGAIASAAFFAAMPPCTDWRRWGEPGVKKLPCA